MKRRWIALIVAVAMLAPAAASAAEGAMATWLSPQPGQIVSGGRVEIAIGYNTHSNLKVSSLELYADGQFVVRKVLRAPESRGVCSFYWDTARVVQGSHNIVVKVFAGDQMISKVYGTATVGPNRGSSGLTDVRPPIVTFANIKAGDVLKGTATVKMNAADDSGQSPMVSLLVDDVLKLLRNTPPYQYDLDTTTYADGDHSLKTYAYDGAGNRSDPAVVKVAFRNGVDKPVITTMSVNREVAPDASSASVSEVPPSIGLNAQPSIRESGRTAARIEQTHSVAPVVAEPKIKSKPVEAAPKPKLVAVAPKAEVTAKHSLPAPKLESKLKTASVVAGNELRSSRTAPKPDTRMSAAAPDVKSAAPAAKPAAPVLTSKPVRMASATAASDIRKATAAPAMSAKSAAAKPAVTESAQSSGIRSASVTRLPEAKPAVKSAPKSAPVVKSAAPRVSEPKIMAAAPKPVAPKPALAAPKSSGATKMAMAPQSLSPRATTHKSAPNAALSTAPTIVDRPVSSAVKNAIVDHKAAGIKSVKLASGKISNAASAPPRTVAPPVLSKSAMKQVRVAMAPDVRGAIGRTTPSPAIACPPALPKNAKAKLEKAVVPASGKVKARSFFEKLGGVLFWDPATHMVTVCINDMVLDMRIGSKIAKVNGHEIQMESAPYLVNDRTVFEASAFTQARALMDSLGRVGFKIHSL